MTATAGTDHSNARAKPLDKGKVGGLLYANRARRTPDLHSNEVLEVIETVTKPYLVCDEKALEANEVLEVIETAIRPYLGCDEKALEANEVLGAIETVTRPCLVYDEKTLEAN